MGKMRFNELSSASISKNKFVVISQLEEGPIVIAQKIVHIDEDTKEKVSMFCKGSIMVRDRESLENMRDAIIVAITKTKSKEKEEWEDDFEREGRKD